VYLQIGTQTKPTSGEDFNVQKTFVYLYWFLHENIGSGSHTPTKTQDELDLCERDERDRRSALVRRHQLFVGMCYHKRCISA
jgi:hypothetical protein